MKVRIKSVGSFNHATSYLEKCIRSDPKKALKAIGQVTCETLSKYSPVDTGEFAAGWGYEIDNSGGTSNVSIYNKAHSEEVNDLPLLLEYGHGTGTGGWVPGTHFVEKSMAEISDTIDEKIGELIQYE